MKKPKPKSYHHGNLYETLVKAGTSLLKDEGLSNFTLRETARRAGWIGCNIDLQQIPVLGRIFLVKNSLISNTQLEISQKDSV